MMGGAFAMTTQTTVNYAVVFADGPGPLNIAVIVVRSVNIRVLAHGSLFQYVMQLLMLGSPFLLQS